MGLIVENGKPSSTAAGCALGIIGAPLLLFGGGWLLGRIEALLSWLFGWGTEVFRHPGLEPGPDFLSLVRHSRGSGNPAFNRAAARSLS